MRNKRLKRSVLNGVALLLLCGAAAAAELVIPGSGNPEHVLGMLAQEFNSRQDKHRVSIPPSTGTAGAIRDVLGGKAVLGRVGRPLKDSERSKGLAYLPLGRDAVVFVAGTGVTVKAVTASQMIDAYTGKLTDWAELGGKPGPIRAIGREAGDASREAIAARIVPFRDIAFGAGIKVVHLDPQMISLLDRYDTSLGMMNRSALFAARTKVVPLALDGTEPTPDNLASGRYPLWLEFGLVHTAGESLPEEARAFIDFIHSAEGVRILRAHGVIQASGL